MEKSGRNKYASLKAVMILLMVLLLVSATRGFNCDSTASDFEELVELVQMSRREAYEFNNIPMRTVLKKIKCLDRKVNRLVNEVASLHRLRRSM